MRLPKPTRRKAVWAIRIAVVGAAATAIAWKKGIPVRRAAPLIEVREVA
jgi:hypothetical protein